MLFLQDNFELWSICQYKSVEKQLVLYKKIERYRLLIGGSWCVLKMQVFVYCEVHAFPGYCCDLLHGKEHNFAYLECELTSDSHVSLLTWV